MECSICYEKMHTRRKIILPCGHEFHEHCILRWCEYQMTCPHCRAAFFFGPPERYDPVRVVAWIAIAAYVFVFFLSVMGGRTV